MTARTYWKCSTSIRSLPARSFSESQDGFAVRREAQVHDVIVELGEDPLSSGAKTQESQSVGGRAGDEVNAVIGHREAPIGTTESRSWVSSPPSIAAFHRPAVPSSLLV